MGRCALQRPAGILDKMRRNLRTHTPGALRKAATGIQGLDEITGGGLPAGRPTLVCGGAGCGKTMLAVKFLVRGATKYGEPGVFIMSEENAVELAANVRSPGMDLDHKLSRDTLAKLLTRRGYEVTPAPTVAEALAAAHRKSFDFVISDLGLPDGDGLQMMLGLRAALGPKVQAIAMSGYGTPEDVERSHVAGFSVHLTKPVGIALLETALHELEK